MTITISSHITDYWLSNNIIDCSNIIEISEEKLNNNYDHEITNIINESTTEYKNINRECRDGKVSKIYLSRQSNRNENSNYREFNPQKTNEYNNVFKKNDEYEYERKMYKLSKDSRICEYESRRRKILLDTCPKNRIKNSFRN
jgi:hypothetical protein